MKMNTPVWRGLAQTGVFNSIKICMISHVAADAISFAATFTYWDMGAQDNGYKGIYATGIHAGKE